MTEDQARLESWKEIAAYLKKDTTTAQRWEKEEGLPVHRHTHKSRSSVYAYPSEIDAWRASRKSQVEPCATVPRPLWKIPAFALTMLLCLITVGNGIRPVSAQTKPVTRTVWTGPKVDLFGRVSPDGRFITFVDWNNGSLMVHNLAANEDRNLTPISPNYSEEADYSTFSRDGKRVAYGWFTPENLHQVRIIDFQPSGFAKPRLLLSASDAEVAFLSPHDWSPDGRWIAADLRKRDGTGEIGLISVANGSLTPLKSTDWNTPETMFFSSDSKYLAYAVPASGGSGQRDIFIMAVDGSHETPAVVNPANDELLGWSPDGSQLLFASDRTGSTSVWSLPVSGGKPQGKPELLRADIGPGITSLGLTASGTLYFYKSIGYRDFSIAPIDLSAGKLTGPPVPFDRGFLPRTLGASWSHDGKYFAYAACGGNCLAIRSVETGEVRKLPTSLTYVRAPRWSPDDRLLAAAGGDPKGRRGGFLIDTQTGKTSMVVDAEQFRQPEWSADGTKIYYFSGKHPGTDPSIIEKDLASGTERIVMRHPRLRQQVLKVSRDGQYLVVQTDTDPDTTISTLWLVPIAGGQPRELVRLNQPEAFIPPESTAWTPDSRAVLFVKADGAHSQMWMAPVDGSAARKLDIDPETWRAGAAGGIDQGFSLSPDGRRLAFLTGKSEAEVWTLEHFLPARASARQ